MIDRTNRSAIDPKDAQVILHLLKTGTTQRFVDPLVSGDHDLQEIANTYQQVSLRKVFVGSHHLAICRWYRPIK